MDLERIGDYLNIGLYTLSGPTALSRTGNAWVRCKEVMLVEEASVDSLRESGVRSIIFLRHPLEPGGKQWFYSPEDPVTVVAYLNGGEDE